MKSSLALVFSLVLLGCGSDTDSTDNSRKAESRYSEMLKYSRDTAEQLQQSMQDSAARSDQVLQRGE